MNKRFDIVITVGPHEQMNLNLQLRHIRKNIRGFRRIYLIPFKLTYEIDRAANENDDCIVINENDIPIFKDMKMAISEHFDSTFPGKKNRNGWYLQQLIKLYAGIVIPDILHTYLVIDSDVFFLKKVQFFDNTKPLYETGTENHLPYFEHMKRLHPTFKRMTNNSGICHHMMFETKYVKDMMKMVEDYHHNQSKNYEKPFWKIFIESVGEHLHYSVDYEESGASEYELYFNFMLQFHSSKISVRTNNNVLKWENKPKSSTVVSDKIDPSSTVVSDKIDPSSTVVSDKIDPSSTTVSDKIDPSLHYISICHYM